MKGRLTAGEKFQLRPWRNALATLPLVTPPLRGELPNSYLARLAEDNRWDLHAIATNLGEVDSTVRSYAIRSDSWRTGELVLNDLAIDRLAALTGRSAVGLARTLGSLGTHRRRTPRSDVPTLHWSAIYNKPVRTADFRVVRPCPRCAAKHGITAAVSVLCPLDEPACTRHGIWLADFPAAPPFSITGHADLTAALRHHRNLRRRHPAEALTAAFGTARTIWFRYKPNVKPEHADAIHRRWDARAVAIAPHADRTWLAVLYPEIVALAGVLVSDHWTAAAARPYIKKPYRGDRPDLLDFLEEVARRIGHTEPAKFAKASSSVGLWARQTFPNHTKRRFGYYPAYAKTAR